MPRGKAWRREEEFALERLAGQFPRKELIYRFRLIAAKKRWPKRSWEAIQSKLVKLGISLRCEIDNLTASQIAALLKISQERVKRWCRLKLLRYESIAHNRWSISIANFQEFASQHPEELWGTDLEGLKFLGVSEGLIQVALKSKPRRFSGTVLRLDTGEEFQSVSEAARKCYLDRSSINAVLCGKRKTAGGTRWERRQA